MPSVVPRIVNNVSYVTRISHDSHFAMAGAVFGDVELSLFVAGAAFGEIWNDSRSAKCCIFQYKMPVVGVKSNLGCEAGCGVTVSFSDHSRILLGSCSDPARNLLGSAPHWK